MGNRWRWTRVAAGTHWSQCIHLTHECHSCSAATALGMAEGHVVVRNPSNLAASFCLPKKVQEKRVHRRSRPSPAPVPPLGIRALLARLLSRTPRARVRGGGDRGLAPQQCSRSCTASANQLQLQCTAKKPTRRFPRPVCEAPRTALFAAPSSGAAASPAASCAMHCTPLVQDLQRHAPHLRRRAHSSAAHALLPRGN